MPISGKYVGSVEQLECPISSSANNNIFFSDEETILYVDQAMME